ncbi:MAG TPA: hypothetical protein VK553_03830, partial [Candidatus Nitrosopolaris rasttigaisensis]|nr:hypothetical protein [Candidatus Nitrosopolaris rasttigaisensis]
MAPAHSIIDRLKIHMCIKLVSPWRLQLAVTCEKRVNLMRQRPQQVLQPQCSIWTNWESPAGLTVSG